MYFILCSDDLGWIPDYLFLPITAKPNYLQWSPTAAFVTVDSISRLLDTALTVYNGHTNLCLDQIP